MGHVAIFYSDYAYSTGLIRLGTIDAGLEELATTHEDFTVSFGAVSQDTPTIDP